MRGASNGSSRKVTAISTENRGATPIAMAARETPASRSAFTHRICDAPGTNMPATKYGQSSPASTSSAVTPDAAVTATRIGSAMTAITKPPTSASGNHRIASLAATLTAPSRTPARQP